MLSWSTRIEPQTTRSRAKTAQFQKCENCQKCRYVATSGLDFSSWCTADGQPDDIVLSTMPNPCDSSTILPGHCLLYKWSSSHKNQLSPVFIQVDGQMI